MLRQYIAFVCPFGCTKAWSVKQLNEYKMSFSPFFFALPVIKLCGDAFQTNFTHREQLTAGVWEKRNKGFSEGEPILNQS